MQKDVYFWMDFVYERVTSFSMLHLSDFYSDVVISTSFISFLKE